MQLTVQVQLTPDDVQATALLQTMYTFNEICNHVSKIAFEYKCFHPVALHNLKLNDSDITLYYQLRNTHSSINSVHIQLAFRKVADAYRIRLNEKKKLKKPCIFKNTSAITYNIETLNVRSVEYSPINYSYQTLSTVAGRIKLFGVFGDHQSQLLLTNCKTGEVKLIYHNKQFYLNITTNQPEAQLIEPTSYLGVDLGINNIATTSHGKIYSGAQIDQIRTKYHTHRSSLQQCSTKSAKRRLKQISGKEASFRKDINHCLSKEIVVAAKGTNSGIVLEDLTHIREQTTVRKQQRSRHHSWSFHQLRSFITYKAQLRGIPVIVVDPRYTSQRCSSCGHTERKNRKSQFRFHCCSCGHDAHADYNAACNLAMIGHNKATLY